MDWQDWTLSQWDSFTLDDWSGFIIDPVAASKNFRLVAGAIYSAGAIIGGMDVVGRKIGSTYTIGAIIGTVSL